MSAQRTDIANQIAEVQRDLNQLDGVQLIKNFFQKFKRGQERPLRLAAKKRRKRTGQSVPKASSSCFQNMMGKKSHTKTKRLSLCNAVTL